MSCTNIYLQLARLGRITNEYQELLRLLKEKSISFTEFVKKDAELKKSKEEVDLFLRLQERERYQLGAIFREKLNLLEVGKFENGFANARDTSGNRLCVDLNGKVYNKEIPTKPPEEYPIKREKRNGKFVFTLPDGSAINKEVYVSANEFSCGLAAVAVRSYGGETWHYITKDGLPLNDKVYDWAGTFHNGRAEVTREDGSSYSIDINGKRMKYLFG